MAYDIKRQGEYWLLFSTEENVLQQIPEDEMLAIAHKVLKHDIPVSNIGRHIRYVRKAAKISQEKAAEELGISRAGLGNIERGDTRINFMTVGTYDAIVEFIVKHYAEAN